VVGSVYTSRFESRSKIVSFVLRPFNALALFIMRAQYRNNNYTLFWIFLIHFYHDQSSSLKSGIMPPSGSVYSVTVIVPVEVENAS
jgi:hypothetical protein